MKDHEHPVEILRVNVLIRSSHPAWKRATRVVARYPKKFSANDRDLILPPTCCLVRGSSQNAPVISAREGPGRVFFSPDSIQIVHQVQLQLQIDCIFSQLDERDESLRPGWI